MTVGMPITSDDREYNARITSFVLLSCAVAATGGIIFGYDIGISGGLTSMDQFLKKFFRDAYAKVKDDTETSNYCKIDSQLLTAFTSSLHIAGLIASFLASPVTRALWRKTSILLGGAAFLIGSAFGGAAYNVYMLIIGRIILGIGVGLSNQSVPLYLSEMAPPRYGGAFATGLCFCVGLGVLLANLINYGAEKIKVGWGWRISLATAAAPVSFLTSGVLFLPETPRSLVQQSNNHTKTTKQPYKDILRRKYRPQFIMSLAIPFFQQVTGIDVVSFYAPVLFRTIGLGESASLSSAVMTGIIGSTAILLTLLIADEVWLLTWSVEQIWGTLLFFSQILIGGITAAKLGDHGQLSKAYGFLVPILICTYVAGFGLSWGPLGWLIPSEIFPLR